MSKISKSKEKPAEQQCFAVLNEKKDDVYLVLNAAGEKSGKELQCKELE